MQVHEDLSTITMKQFSSAEEFPIQFNDCDLQNTRIDIWEFTLDELPAQASSLLNETELARARRFYFERHRRRFTIARAMLRLILGRYLQCAPNQLIFSYNQHGKPQICHPEAVEFNLSHSQDLALLAIGKQFPLGVDLEFFSERPYDGIAHNLFSPQELQLFLKLPAYLKPHAFFQIWAQKEAFIKACGMGLSYPTQNVDVPIFPLGPMIITDPMHKKDWSLTTFMPRIACSAAICCDPKITELRYFSLKNPSSLFI